MYKQLLYRENGGISPRRNAPMPAKNNNMFFGLGRAGWDCLQKIKNQLYLLGIAPKKGETVYPNARFFYVGWDNERPETDAGDVFFPIYTNDRVAFLKSEALLGDPSYAWLKSPGSEPKGQSIAIDHNVVRSRQEVRALLFRQAAELKVRLERFIFDAKKATPGANGYIHLYIDLGDLLAAGIFLDFCYLIRKIQQELTVEGIRVLGYFILPDASRVDFQWNGADRAARRAAAVASLKELDYCMNLFRHGERWEQTYGRMTVKHAGAPVDCAILLGDPFQDAAMAVADFAKLFLLAPHDISGDADAIMNQIFTLLNKAMVENGSDHKYLTLGTAVAQLSHSDIATFSTSLLFDRFADDRAVPAPEEVDAFLDSLQLKRLDDVIRQVRAGMHGPYFPEMDTALLYEQAQACNHHTQYPAQLYHRYMDHNARMESTLHGNKGALLEELDVSRALDHHADHSLINRLFARLADLSCDVEKGPFYATALLRDYVGRTLEGMIAENDRRIAMTETTLRLRDDAYAFALSDLKKSSILNRKSRAKQLIEVAYSRCMQECDIKVLQAVKEVLFTFKKQTEQLYGEYFAKMETVLRELQDTFKDNIQWLYNGLPMAPQNKLISLQDKSVTSWLEQQLQKTNVASVFYDWMRRLFATDGWPKCADRELVELVNDFFAAESNINVEGGLRIQYDLGKIEDLSPFILRDVIAPLHKQLQPQLLFCSDYRMNDDHSLLLGCYPYEEVSVTAAIHQFGLGLPMGTPFTPIAGVGSAGIGLIKLYCGIPLWAQRPMVAEETVSHTIGDYIYEASARDGRVMGMRDELIPFSCLPECRMRDCDREKAALLDLALSLGVLRREGDSLTDEFCLAEADEALILHRVDLIDRLIDQQLKDGMRLLLDEILPPSISERFAAGEAFSDEDLYGGYPVTAQRELSFIGSLRYSERVVKDRFYCLSKQYAWLEKNTRLAEQYVSALRRAVAFLSENKE